MVGVQFEQNQSEISMSLKRTSLAVNSSLILITTTLIGTLLHEFAHFIVALYYDVSPVLHHNYVSFDESKVNAQQHTIIAAAGPLFSLMSGCVIIYWSKKIKKIGLIKLFLLWLGMNGILMFLGYLLIAPFAEVGDTGKVFHYFGWPKMIMLLVAIASFMVILKIFKGLSKQFRFYKSSEVFDQKNTAKQLFLIPILADIVIVTLLSLPVPVWVSLLPTVFMPMTYWATMGSYKGLEIKNPVYYNPEVSKELLFIFILTVGIFISLK